MWGCPWLCRSRVPEFRLLDSTSICGRVAELREGKDRTREVEAADLRQETLFFTADPAEMAKADFFIVTVPTPIDEAHRSGPAAR